MDYDDANRAFLQAFLSRGALTFAEAQPVLAAIFTINEGRQTNPNDVTLDDLNSYISAANIALSPLDLEIRSTFHQQTRDRFYALVNTTSDAMTQLATTYSADEIAYVKKLLDELFDGSANTERKEAMCISGRDALQLVRSGRRETQNGETQASKSNMTQHEAETLLGKLVAEGWMEKSPKGFYSLSPRALMELKGWLVETYNEEPLANGEVEEEDRAPDKIKFCRACKEVITVGQRCAKRNCPCRLHDICTQNFFRVHRSRKCPVCETEWDGKHYVGEKAITTSEAYLRGKRRSGARPELEEEDQDGLQAQGQGENE